MGPSRFRGGLRPTPGAIGTFPAARNDDPSPGCLEAATASRHYLNRQCPARVSRAEIRRRERVQRALDRSRSFNRDTVAAEIRWSALYARNLPRAFRDVTPQMIVERHLASALDRTPSERRRGAPPPKDAWRSLRRRRAPRPASQQDGIGSRKFTAKLVSCPSAHIGCVK